MTFSGPFQAPFSKPFPSAGVAIPWWLSGGIAAANCIAAYSAKGAADYAASKVNLANPGTYNAADGAAYPTWDATNGWKFLGSSTQYLTTGIVPATGWSMIVRYSNYVSGDMNILGTYKAGARFEIALMGSVPLIYYMSGGVGSSLHAIASSGVLGVANQQGYLNGSTDGGAISAWSASAPPAMYIGDRAGASYPFTGYIQAFAIYSTSVATQMAALTTAMNAL